MKIKDLKINFRYLGGNIACLSVDSIAGESIHNDIDNEEAIIIFNSLVGEKENCQTVKTLLKENQELKDKISDMQESYETDAEAKFYDYVDKHESKLEKENQELKKQLEERTKMYLNAYKYSQGMENEVITLNTQQKEFIRYLEDEIEELQKIKETELDYDILKDVIPQLLVCKNVLQKYKSIIGVSNERKS